MNAWSCPTAPCNKPPLDSTRVPSAIERVAPGEGTGAGNPPAGEADRRVERAAEDDDRAGAAAHAREHAGQHAEVVLADRDPAVRRDHAVQGGREHHAGAESREHEEAGAHEPADPAAPDQVDGAERQPRHVEQGAQQEEHPERAVVPAGRSGGGERGRRECEQREREGPRPLVGSLGPGVTHARGLGEQRRDGSGEEGEAGDHGAPRVPAPRPRGPRRKCPHTLRTRAQARYPGVGPSSTASTERTSG